MFFMGATQIIGIIGVTCLLVAWMFQNYRTFKAANIDAVDVNFITLSFIGSSILAYYAARINDLPFLVLNGFIAAAIAVQLGLIAKHYYDRNNLFSQ